MQVGSDDSTARDLPPASSPRRPAVSQAGRQAGSLARWLCSTLSLWLLKSKFGFAHNSLARSLEPLLFRRLVLRCKRRADSIQSARSESNGIISIPQIIKREKTSPSSPTSVTRSLQHHHCMSLCTVAVFLATSSSKRTVSESVAKQTAGAARRGARWSLTNTKIHDDVF